VHAIPAIPTTLTVSPLNTKREKLVRVTKKILNLSVQLVNSSLYRVLIAVAHGVLNLSFITIIINCLFFASKNIDIRSNL